MTKNNRFYVRLDDSDTLMLEEIKNAFNNNSMIKLTNSDIFRILIKSGHADLKKEGKL